MVMHGTGSGPGAISRGGAGSGGDDRDVVGNRIAIEPDVELPVGELPDLGRDHLDPELLGELPRVCHAIRESNQHGHRTMLANHAPDQEPTSAPVSLTPCVP